MICLTFSDWLQEALVENILFKNGTYIKYQHLYTRTYSMVILHIQNTLQAYPCLHRQEDVLMNQLLEVRQTLFVRYGHNQVSSVTFSCCVYVIMLLYNHKSGHAYLLIELGLWTPCLRVLFTICIVFYSSYQMLRILFNCFIRLGHS